MRPSLGLVIVVVLLVAFLFGVLSPAEVGSWIGDAFRWVVDVVRQLIAGAAG